MTSWEHVRSVTEWARFVGFRGSFNMGTIVAKGRAIAALLLLQGCTASLAGDAESNCERYRETQIAWLQACGLTVTGPGEDCSRVLWFTSSSEVDRCEVEIWSTPCGQPTPDPCGGIIVRQPW